MATITYDGTNFILEQEVPASTTRKGSVELATDAEAIARTDTTRYITPKTGNDIVNKEIYI